MDHGVWATPASNMVWKDGDSLPSPDHHPHHHYHFPCAAPTTPRTCHHHNPTLNSTPPGTAPQFSPHTYLPHHTHTHTHTFRWRAIFAIPPPRRWRAVHLAFVAGRHVAAGLLRSCVHFACCGSPWHSASATPAAHAFATPDFVRVCMTLVAVPPRITLHVFVAPHCGTRAYVGVDGTGRRVPVGFFLYAGTGQVRVPHAHYPHTPPPRRAFCDCARRRSLLAFSRAARAPLCLRWRGIPPCTLLRALPRTHHTHARAHVLPTCPLYARAPTAAHLRTHALSRGKTPLFSSPRGQHLLRAIIDAAAPAWTGGTGGVYRTRSCDGSTLGRRPLSLSPCHLQTLLLAPFSSPVTSQRLLLPLVCVQRAAPRARATPYYTLSLYWRTGQRTFSIA